MEHSKHRPEPRILPARPTEGAASPYDDAFPAGFDFFHLGRVELVSSCALPDAAASPFMVVFRVSGDEMGTCVVAFEQAPQGRDEESMSIEMGNILVSKLATTMADRINGAVDVSPPEALHACDPRHRSLTSTFLKSADQGSDYVVRLYRFLGNNGAAARLRVAYLPAKPGRS